MGLLLPILITTLLTLAVALVVIVIGVGVFSAALLLVQQQASATTTTTIIPTASHNNNKCSGGDIVTCTHNKKTHPTKDATKAVDWLHSCYVCPPGFVIILIILIKIILPS